jgi:hypothetical protein
VNQRSPALSTTARWLKSPDEAPAAERLALVVAAAGPAGVSLDDLSSSLDLPPENLRDILRALTATGHVVAVSVGGNLVYRARG